MKANTANRILKICVLLIHYLRSSDDDSDDFPVLSFCV